MSTVQEGWPSTLVEVPAEIKPYFQFRDEITAQNGLLFKGERLNVPDNLRKETMERVHSSHRGIEGCLRRDREVFYWPRMNAEVKDFILKCDICNLYKPAQPREPLIPHEIPSRLWEKVGTVLFLFDCLCNISFPFSTNFLMLIILRIFVNVLQVLFVLGFAES